MEANNHANTNKQPFVIECEHIILREFIANDLDDFHSLTWQPEIYEFLPGWNVPKEQRTDWFLNYEVPQNKQFFDAVNKGEDIGEHRLRLGIILKETGQLIGWCCSGLKDELPAPNREIMYAISKDYRGRGYTTEAVQAIIQYLFEHTNVKVLSAVALINNIPSNKVLQKCNFEYEGKIEIDNDQYHYYKLNK